jgi:hypothetical protein
LNLWSTDAPEDPATDAALIAALALSFGACLPVLLFAG